MIDGALAELAAHLEDDIRIGDDMDEITNLLQETIKDITSHDKTVEDVQWVGSLNGAYAISWGQFAVIAEQTNYDSGFGGNEICGDLAVVGSDWWLERHGYDGSEWWEFKQLPRRKANAQPFTEVRTYSIEDANK